MKQPERIVQSSQFTVDLIGFLLCAQTHAGSLQVQGDYLYHSTFERTNMEAGRSRETHCASADYRLPASLRSGLGTCHVEGQGVKKTIAVISSLRPQ
jgi:hypothetical protein